MFKHLSLSCLLLAIVAPLSVSAAPKVGTISGVVPEAYKSKNSCADSSDWTAAKYGAKFELNNCFKTSDGGAIELKLKGDNSVLTIAENSVVSIKDLIEDDGSGNYVIKPDIRKGYMGFNVEKNKGNKVDFSTGTAAASIRGTEGFIGDNGNAFFAGLKNGRLMILPVNVDSLSIGEGETVIGKGEFAVLKLRSSGDMGFAKILDTLLADTSMTFEEMKAAVIYADSVYQESLLRKSSAADRQAGDRDNMIPQIKYSSYDSLRCVANVSVSDVAKGTEARLSVVMDGMPISEISVKRNMPKRLALRSGVHEYEFVVENDVGRSSARKKLGCYPMKPFSVKVFGKRHEHIQVPPPPPIPGIEDLIMQTLQFQIRVPDYDPSSLNKVTIRQDGKVILQERLSQIQNLDYQIPVELKRAHKNRFDIEVVHKSGYAVRTAKIYEVDK